MSGKQLYDPDLVTELEALLNEIKLPPQRLDLEITETVAMENADATSSRHYLAISLGYGW